MNYFIYDYRTMAVLFEAETWSEINEIWDDLGKEIKPWTKIGKREE